MDKQRLTLAVLTVLPFVMACGSDTAGDPAGASAASEVAGVHWKVDSVTVDGTTRHAPAGADADLRIGKNGTAEGSYGCNEFGAKAALTGHHVKLTHARQTLMACEPARMAFERAFSHTLVDHTLTADLKGNKLTLTTHDGDRIHLTKEQDTPLYGTKWTITSLGRDGTAASLPPQAKGSAYLTFDKKSGKVTGRLGCNHVTAKATVRDGRITLGPASTTRMMCDASLMHTEKSLLRLFDGTATYRVDHRTLTLTSENGESAEAVAGR
ncbi:META domain-containing protein [Streptomyces spinosirectus]|jgi:heat shock protein HslJ|uniref:META domain-containing protein n=1 Tax=Streptomyces TaxID=1883 RepID=UPI000D3B76DB|nr:MULTISPECIES: META domain-containing protein [Streptomyces]MBY8344440.1 META domain-containing protein [Streptomyces plumbidurans]PTM85576.1 heat shock protein HslJ [Streptomyces sp. VMFN-G11Ma]UIR19487.1 META domain-containing protein [Streptomyces spinosirectus]